MKLKCVRFKEAVFGSITSVGEAHKAYSAELVPLPGFEGTPAIHVRYGAREAFVPFSSCKDIEIEIDAEPKGESPPSEGATPPKQDISKPVSRAKGRSRRPKPTSSARDNTPSG